MDHARLRDVAGKCRAAKTVLEHDGQITLHQLFAVALDAIIELVDAVAANEPDLGSVHKHNEHQLSLGELIQILAAWPKQDDACLYDFGGLAPDGLDSYRGYYDQLAMGFSDKEKYPNPTVAKVLEWCEAAVGKTFTGYKGGDYVMTERTPVWVANYGEAGGTAIVGVVPEVTHHLVLRTACLD